MNNTVKLNNTKVHSEAITLLHKSDNNFSSWVMVRTSNWLTGALPLPMPSRIWFFPALKGVYK